MVDNSWFEGKNSPGAGDLGEIQALQSNLSDTADAAQHARTSLNGLKDKVSDAVWRGKPAEEFKDNISSDFLGQLDKLHTSYADAAAGFQTYINAVSEIKGKAEPLAQKIYTAQTTYNTHASALHQWLLANPDSGSYSHGDLTASGYKQGAPYTVTYHAAPAPAGTKPDSAAAHSAATAAANASSNHQALQGNVNDAYNALQALYRQMDTLKTHDRVQADNAVVSKIDHAGSEGMRNESGWHKFFHALSTVAKWVGVALVVVAVIAVAVALTGGVGLIAALSVLATDTFIGGLVVYGGVAVSALALTGDLGQTFTGGGPGLLKIGLDVVGLVPGLGKATELLGSMGPGAARVASALSDSVLLGKMHLQYGLEGLMSKVEYTNFGLKFAGTMGKLETIVNAGGKAIWNYGFNLPPDSKFGAIKYALQKTNGLWNGAGMIFPTISRQAVTAGGKALYHSVTQDLSSKDAQAQIKQYQQSNPSGAAKAHQIAQNLAKGDKGTYSYPKQHTYPQSVPVH